MRRYKAPKNTVIVALGKPQNYMKHRGLSIKIDDSWNPEKYAPVSGKVVGVPTALSTRLQTDIDVREGDKVYFHYNIAGNRSLDVDPVNNIKSVPYNLIWCIYRKGELIMCNDRIFVKPVTDPQKEMKTKSGLIVKKNENTRYLIGQIAAIGKPPKNDQWIEKIQKGDHILFEVDSEFEVYIEEVGKVFYCMQWRDVMAKVNREDIKSINISETEMAVNVTYGRETNNK